MISKAFHINFLGIQGVGKTTYINKLKSYNNILWTNKDLLSIVPYEEPNDPFIQSSFFKKMFICDGNIIMYSENNSESMRMVDKYIKITEKYNPKVKTIICNNSLKRSNYIDISFENNTWKQPLETILSHIFKEAIVIKN